MELPADRFGFMLHDPFCKKFTKESQLAFIVDVSTLYGLLELIILAS